MSQSLKWVDIAYGKSQSGDSSADGIYIAIATETDTYNRSIDGITWTEHTFLKYHGIMLNLVKIIL